MNYEEIEKYYEDRGKNIARILRGTYDSADLESSSGTVEEEITDIAMSYAKIFFFEAQSFLSEENRMTAKTQVRSRFDASANSIEKMQDIELVAHMIKSEVIKGLEEDGTFI